MESLESIGDLIKTCLLPELKQDLDSIPIDRDEFKHFLEYLEKHLPLLYDCLQQDLNSFLLNDEELHRNPKKREVRVYLMILLFEISSNSIFKLHQAELINTANRILQSIKTTSKDVDDMIFKYYEEKLCTDGWKRQLGAIHGFVKYIEFQFSAYCGLEQSMNQKCIMFCLSVALNIRSCHETFYKTLSTTIFLIMLQKGANDAIISMNIHSVIYDAVFKDICIMDSIPFIIQQWNCLIKCLDFYDNFDSFTWNHLDDMMEVLLRNISLSPDVATSLCLLKFVNKLIIYFTIDNKVFEKFFTNDLIIEENVNEFRSLARVNTSYTCYRWAKAILQMFVLESYKLLQAADIVKPMLQEIHKIYILAIVPIRLPVIEPHLIIFFDKYIAVLMEAVKVHISQTDVIQVIVSILETFYFHLQGSEKLENLYDFKASINELLKTDIFKKYTVL